MTPRNVRALRGGLAASVASLLGATAHTLAGGGAPAPSVVAAVAILAWPAAVAFAGRRLSVWRTGATVAVSQILLHFAFVLTAGADPTLSIGHDHHGSAALDPVMAASMSGLLPAPSMLAAHLAAAAVTVTVLWWGERMLTALAGGIRTLFSRMREVVPPARAALPRVSFRRPAGRRAGVALSSLSRRGPPALVIAAS